MTKVICSGLGSGSGAYEKEVPTLQLFPCMTTEGVQITVSLDAYKRLVNWASMGRTLNGVIDALSEIQSDLSDDALDEINTVRAALDECHQAVRRHWGALP